MSRKRKSDPLKAVDPPVPTPAVEGSGSFLRSRKAGLFRVLVLLLAIVGFLAGIIFLGKRAREQIQGWERYALPILEIDCVPPPGQERPDFLAEVQYLGGLPDKLEFLDPQLGERLTEAFGKHPMVDRVNRLMIAPPKHVEVRLQYRVPVLVVSDRVPPPPGSRWVLDAHAILLPSRAFNDLLLVFKSDFQPEQAFGEPATDAVIKGAARTADFLRAHQDRLHFQRLEPSSTGLVLYTSAGSLVRWGSPAGASAPTEPSADEKVQRLLRYCQEHGSLDQPSTPMEHDLRPKVGVVARPLAP
jgi:hypothetical protein